jgi:beta-lactamase class A
MKELKRYLDSRIGEYSFYFEDIDSGYTYSLNEKVIMPSASCIKVPIAMIALKEVQDHNLSLNKSYLVKKEEMVEGSGIIHEFDEKEYSLRELIYAMLIQSDNTATNKIIDIIGMDKINKVFKEIGLKDTYLKRKMMDFSAREKGLENLTSSYDLAECFKSIYYFSFLNKEFSELLTDILRKSQHRDKIPFYIPEREWDNIGNKSGNLNGIENDAAILNIEKGNFVFVVMSKSLPNNVYGIATISRMGKMMWDIVDRNWK